MDAGLFLLGMLGALLVVYLAKQEVVPEFRPLFDTSGAQDEAREHRDHIKKTENEIDGIQAKLRDGDSLSADQTQRLATVLNTSLSEIQVERVRLQTLEREIVRNQLISRSLGFLFYIILGGVFGFLLAGKIKVEGLSGDLPTYFQSIVIGATWTTYLSAIGFRSGQDKANERIEAFKKEAGERIETLKRELTPRVAEKVANAERADKVETPVLAGEVERMLTEEIDRTNMAMQKKLEQTRQMVRRDVKGLL